MSPISHLKIRALKRKTPSLDWGFGSSGAQVGKPIKHQLASWQSPDQHRHCAFSSRP